VIVPNWGFHQRELATQQRKVVSATVNPVLGSGSARTIQLGLKFIFSVRTVWN